MEDGELDAAPAEVVPAAELEVEQGATETEQAAGEVEDLTAAIEDAVEDAGTLGEIQDTMADTVTDGEGMSEDAAQIAEVAVEAICARLGIRSKTSTIPAMESFGSKNSRLAATRIAVENVGEKLKTLWEAVKKAFATVWQKIKDFFAKFFSNTEKVKKLAKELKDQVSSKKDAKPKEAQIDVGSAAKAIQKDGKFDPSTVEAVMTNHANLTNGINKSFELLRDVVGAADAIAKGAEGGEDKIGKALEQFAKTVTAPLNPEVTENGDTMTLKVGPFVNNNFISLEITRGANYGAKLENTEGGKKLESTKIAPLTLDGVSKACDLVVSLMDDTEAYKKNQSKVDALNKSFIDLANAAINFAGKAASASEENADVKKALDKVRVFVSQLNSVSSRITVMIPAGNVRAGKAVLAIASASLKNMVKEEPAK
jgi:hypothetical protein